jgi:GNAT superfamily N-acetyltransferase
LLAASVAELDGRVVGHAILSSSVPADAAPLLWERRDDAGVEGTAMLHRLFVDPAARGHGIGALLVAQVVREAEQRGLHALLEVVDTDSAAAALYERLGWVLLATVEQQWHAGQIVVVRCYAAPTTAS